MKRYLILGALTLITGLFVTSCHEKGEGEMTAPLVQKTAEFEKAFKEAFTSNIDPNQNWGFEPVSNANTRGSNTNAADGNSDWALPADITEAESLKVVNHFADKTKYKSTANPNYTNYWVQQVHKGTHSYTTEPDNNNVTQTASNVSNNMNYLYVIENGQKAHIQRFNSGNGSRMFMEDSNTSIFGYHNSLGSDFQDKFLIQEIDGAYYVGFDYASNATNHVVKADGVYDDWIVKIVPGTKKSSSDESSGDNSSSSTGNTTDDDNYPEKTVTTKTEYFKKRTLVDYGRVFCEDLGGSYASSRKDFDYNDVVFDAYLWKEEEWKKVTTINTYEVQVYDVVTETLQKWFRKTDEQYNEDRAAEIERLRAEAESKGEEFTEPADSLVSHYYRGDYTISYAVLNESKSTKRHEIIEGPTESKVDGKTPKFYTDICLLAAGGTKPLKVGGQDAPEVHNAFGGYAVDCIINTFDEHTVSAGGFGYHETAEPTNLDRMEVTEYINAGEPLIRDIPIYVQLTGLGGAATKIEAEQGEVPQKFMMREKNNWTSERFFLGDAYPNFTNWAEGTTSSFAKGASNASLYGGYPSANAGLSFDVVTGDDNAQNLPVTQTDTPNVTNNTFVEMIINELDGTQTIIPPGTESSGKLPERYNRTVIEEGEGSGTIELAKNFHLTGGVVPIITDQTEAQTIANKIVPGSSKFVLSIKSEANRSKWESWYIQAGPAGNGADGSIISKTTQSTNGYENIQKNDEFVITVTITESIKNKILSNVNNSWWSGGMIGIQGDKLKVNSVKLIY